MEKSHEQITREILQSRTQLGEAALFAASRGVITKDDAKALNHHMGITDQSMLLKHDSRRYKNDYLENIAEVIRARRKHLETHRTIPIGTKLVETTMLALAVGEPEGEEPLDRSELVTHPLTQAFARRYDVNPTIVIDQTIIRDLKWLGVSTKPRSGMTQ